MDEAITALLELPSYDQYHQFQVEHPLRLIEAMYRLYQRDARQTSHRLAYAQRGQLFRSAIVLYTLVALRENGWNLSSGQFQNLRAYQIENLNIDIEDARNVYARARADFPGGFKSAMNRAEVMAARLRMHRFDEWPRSLYQHWAHIYHAYRMKARSSQSAAAYQNLDAYDQSAVLDYATLQLLQDQRVPLTRRRMEQATLAQTVGSGVALDDVRRLYWRAHRSGESMKIRIDFAAHALSRLPEMDPPAQRVADSHFRHLESVEERDLFLAMQVQYLIKLGYNVHPLALSRLLPEQKAALPFDVDLLKDQHALYLEGGYPALLERHFAIPLPTQARGPHVCASLLDFTAQSHTP